MASSIAQPGGGFNCSNFVQLVEVNEGNDLYMEDGDGGHHSEALDSDNEPEPLNFNNQNDFPFDPDDIDAPREVQAMTHAMLSLTQGISKPPNKEQKQEEKRKQREADWTQTEVKDFTADISPFLGAPSGPRGPAALLKSTDSPFKYFQLFFDDKTLETLVQNTRRYANFSGVGTEKRYPNVSANFMDRSRLLRGMSIMMRHGLRPSPSFKSSFKPESGFVSGDNRLNQIFNEYGWLEWQCFRSFFHISDPMNQTRNPQHGGYYKLEPLLSEMRLKMEAAWNLGRSFAIDEMTIGFQGRCRFKQRITYKAEGDGFQCDALCDDKGYTYSFYFRSGICEPHFDHVSLQGIAPLHKRMFWLLSRVDAHDGVEDANGLLESTCPCGCKFGNKHDYQRVYMDNLYLSVKIAELAKEKVTRKLRYSLTLILS
jgi:Transposase IS4